MPLMIVYTSATKSYIPKARVLAKSVKCFHPHWHFVLLFSDKLPDGFDIDKEPFDEILLIENLGIADWESWAFGHTIVELCTAVKGPAAELLALRDSESSIMYLDPDIKVFNSLSELELMLKRHDILLTPHLLHAESSMDAILDNEVCALKHGVYNLGFFAARANGQGLEFIRWWSNRLQLFCVDNIPGGLFTDQRWCDLAPAFFSALGIVRDPGYNVATWNIAHRQISKSESGIYIVGSVPLRFYHFTGYDSGSGFGMLNKYAVKQEIASEIWNYYRDELVAEGHGHSTYSGWHYGAFDNSEPIPLEARRLYQSRIDLKKTFPNPYSTKDPSFLGWWKTELASGRILSPLQNNKNTLIAKLLSSCCSQEGRSIIAATVIRTLRNEGFSGLIRKACNYSQKT